MSITTNSIYIQGEGFKRTIKNKIIVWYTAMYAVWVFQTPGTHLLDPWSDILWHEKLMEIWYIVLW